MKLIKKEKMQKQLTAKINEIFSSIQGEGLYVGEYQTFVRFSKCNMNCAYCDTNFKTGKDYSLDELNKYLQKENTNTISFTGGEPLMEVNFLTEFLNLYKKSLNKKIYLETNGTLYENLSKIIDFIDIIAMDIKLKSATNKSNSFEENEKFLNIANKKEVFIKVVYNEFITKEEIDNVIKLAKKYNNTIILQPVMPLKQGVDYSLIYKKFYKQYKNIRLIPQTHKFLNII